jgi:hypothetical protein
LNNKLQIWDPTAVRFQDRELQLFDGTRLMSAAKFEDLKAAEGLTEAQLQTRGVRKIHPAFREGSSLYKFLYIFFLARLSCRLLQLF